MDKKIAVFEMDKKWLLTKKSLKVRVEKEKKSKKENKKRVLVKNDENGIITLDYPFCRLEDIIRGTQTEDYRSRLESGRVVSQITVQS